MSRIAAGINLNDTMMRGIMMMMMTIIMVGR